MRAGITFFVSGCILMLFGVTMLIPGLLDLADGNAASFQSFALSAGITFFFGTLFVATFQNKYDKLTVREMYLTTSLVWLLVCVFCALPFFFSVLPLDYTDAFFESMSGLTTTGATVITNLNDQPRGILLWRGILQWIGGLGIIVIALGILPLLRIGGMQMYSMEFSDKSDKTLPKTSQIIGLFMLTYAIMSVISLILLYASGLDGFDALTYMLVTVPTGGLAPKASSAIDFPVLTQWVLIFIMFIAGFPIFLPYFIFKKNFQTIKNDLQIKTYTLFTFCTAAFLTVWQSFKFPEKPITDIVRECLFSVSSVITSTGLTNCDISSWGIFAIMFFTFLLPIGACSGSTSGGIKIFRFNILYLSSMQYLRRKILPHGVFVSKYNGKPLTEEITTGVSVFFGIFMVSFLLSALSLALLDLDMMTIVTGSLSTLGDTGVAFGPVIGSSFAPLPAPAKWIFSFNMMLGRLEFMTVFVLLLPLAWRKEKKTAKTASF